MMETLYKATLTPTGVALCRYSIEKADYLFEHFLEEVPVPHSETGDDLYEKLTDWFYNKEINHYFPTTTEIAKWIKANYNISAKYSKQKESETSEGKEDELYSPYCTICEACGEDGCCPPTMCEQHKDGDYCEGYLERLKEAYRAHNRLLIEIDKRKETSSDIEELCLWFDCEPNDERQRRNEDARLTNADTKKSEGKQGEDTK